MQVPFKTVRSEFKAKGYAFRLDSNYSCVSNWTAGPLDSALSLWSFDSLFDALVFARQLPNQSTGV